MTGGDKRILSAVIASAPSTDRSAAAAQAGRAAAITAERISLSPPVTTLSFQVVGDRHQLIPCLNDLGGGGVGALCDQQRDHLVRELHVGQLDRTLNEQASAFLARSRQLTGRGLVQRIDALA